MSIIDHRIALLREQCDKLQSLLNDPQPGLTTWMTMVAEVVARINMIMIGAMD